MANEYQLRILRKGVAAWNLWRIENSDAQIDLTGADLSRVNLAGADLSMANLTKQISAWRTSPGQTSTGQMIH